MATKAPSTPKPPLLGPVPALDPNADVFNVGDCILMSQAPGWVFTGRIVGRSSDMLWLDHAAFVQAFNGGWPEACKDRKAFKTVYAIPGIFGVTTQGIAWVAPATEEVVAHTYLEALEGAK